MILYFYLVQLKTAVKIYSIKDDSVMDDQGTFKKENDTQLYLNYVFDSKNVPKMVFYSPSSKALVVEDKSLVWKSTKSVNAARWFYTPVEKDAGLIVSDKGYCFSRTGNEIGLEKCPDSKDDWRDCMLFRLDIGIDPESVSKCRRTVSRSRGMNIDYDCGKPPQQKCIKKENSSFSAKDTYYAQSDPRNNQSKRPNNQNPEFRNESYDNSRNYESDMFRKTQPLTSNLDDELNLLKGLFVKYKRTKDNN